MVPAKAVAKRPDVPRVLPADARAETVQAVDRFLASSRAVRDQVSMLAGAIGRRVLTTGMGRPRLRDSPIGRVPAAWELRSLGEIACFASGRAKPKDFFRVRSPSHPVPVFSGKGLLGFCGNALHRGATIVVGRVGIHCGAIHLVFEEECWITDAALYVYETRPEVDLRFLYHSLRRLDLASLRTTDHQPLISLSTIYPLLLALPPLEEQREICALMSAAETLRDAQDMVLAHARRVRSALLAAVMAGPA
ncbi:MAG: hypothetical protein A2177_03190 [Spirochaetes bacterium RBG_13_68_11]|nr:MAG: hypothetical protein A2177_03190 [Spirochaetes bacterium RBG_13_68_11]